MRKEPLIFDYDFLKGLANEYQSQKKKYVIVAIASTVLYIAGLLLLVFTVRGNTLWKDYHVILSILVDTFISKISFPMQPGPEIGSISDA